ncbi:MAG: phosphate ABC transporter permease [Gammaproteobacteria bacterium]|nr:phosphate ABC transporter permease [Gammaproteobacteria bacterium]
MAARLKQWIESGSPFIWLSAGAVSILILMVAGLLLLIAVNGLGHFWPAQIASFAYVDDDGSKIQLAGEFADHELVPLARLPETDSRVPPGQTSVDRFLIKTGNRDFLGLDFRWVLGPAMSNLAYPDEMMAVERREWGNFYGTLVEIKDQTISAGPEVDLWEKMQRQIADSGRIFDQIRHIEKNLIGTINFDMERLRLRERKLELLGIMEAAEHEEISRQGVVLQSRYTQLTDELASLYEQFNRPRFSARLADGTEVELPFASVVHTYRPNSMTIFEKTRFYFHKLWEFVTDEPREANTEGGIFPAVFGTVMMVLLMALIVTPFGVVAAVYLHEYAKQGPLTRLIRIAVNNLAGVPSVVYGLFGLGFFVYFVGGNIDELLFPEVLPTPTFGTPGLMWASLTLALLTVPVVIVATEEGLARVPREIREGSLALGATKAETLWRTVLPMTAPSMMTGLILAIARAAGEVAPLMLVGVVKMAPALPLDGNFPYLHLDRKFMHLGFHIYDVGFQSPNVEAARPLVYATALLLVVIIIVLNMTAIRIRNTLREKYRAAEQQ